MGLARRKPVGAAALPLLLLAAARVHLLEIQAAAQVRAFVGEPVTLKCSFKSSAPVTEKLTIDWTYRPLAGGNLEPVFHYQSNAYPAKRGSFQDRISWAGDVAKQDASIMIWNPTLEDNGTFTCSVKNPPDVQHNIPQTLLKVTQRGASFQLTSSGLFSILVFFPSGIVVVLLLVRMNQKSGLWVWKKSKPGLGPAALLSFRVIRRGLLWGLSSNVKRGHRELWKPRKKPMCPSLHGSGGRAGRSPGSSRGRSHLGPHLFSAGSVALLSGRPDAVSAESCRSPGLEGKRRAASCRTKDSDAAEPNGSGGGNTPKP